MKSSLNLLACIALVVLGGCTSEGIQYSRSLFSHVPKEPELLVLVKPNDVSNLLDIAIAELELQKFFGEYLNFDAKLLEHYKAISSEMLKSVGVPWENVESFGFLLLYGQPVILVSGEFAKADVEGKMTELGFKQQDTGYFEYIYSGMMLSVPAEGLMMMAAEDILEDLTDLPEDQRLWNRDDFKEYRSRTPLNNSLFVWSHPPETLLSDFEYRDDLGDVSLAMNFAGGFSMNAAVRVKDPQKVVFLHDIVLGATTMGAGLFGSDADYGPLFKGIKVAHNNKQVEATLVLTADQLISIKDRMADDINNPDSKTFRKLQNYMNAFQ